jgi:hypothetical protein
MEGRMVKIEFPSRYAHRLRIAAAGVLMQVKRRRAAP